MVDSELIQTLDALQKKGANLVYGTAFRFPTISGSAEFRWTQRGEHANVTTDTGRRKVSVVMNPKEFKRLTRKSNKLSLTNTYLAGALLATTDENEYLKYKLEKERKAKIAAKVGSAICATGLAIAVGAFFIERDRRNKIEKALKEAEEEMSEIENVVDDLAGMADAKVDAAED